MTENEIKMIEKISNLSGDYKCYDNTISHEESLILDRLLTEIQQYRAIGTSTQIFEKIGGLDVELGKYHSIGTIEEFKALKHFESNYEHNLNAERNKAIDEFAERIKKEASDCGWNCQNVYGGSCDFVSCEECEISFLKDIDEIAEQMKGEEE